MRHRRAVILLAIIAAVAPARPARAWDSAGHRTITALAIVSLPDSAPAWIGQRSALIADEAVVPDRWRGVRAPALTHANSPEHYIDLEELFPLGLKLETMPSLRYEFIRAVALARVEHPAEPPVNPAADPAKIADWPGFLPWAIAETHAKVVAALKHARIIERLRDRAQDAGDAGAVKLREAQLEMARADAMTHMGILAHYIGDAAQPLHTTIHHHGWVGENPRGFTTDKGFHSYIDGTIVAHHGLDFAALRPGLEGRAIARPAQALDPWPETVALLRRSFESVEPLYELKKSGGLEGEAGKAFIAERLTDAAATLSGFYAAAIEASAPSEEDIKSFLRFDRIEPGQLGPAAAGAPAKAGEP